MIQKKDLAFRSEPTSSDAGAIEDMVARTGFFTPEEVAIARELVDERLQRGLASGYEFVIAEHQGLMVGYTCYGHIAGTDCSYDLYWIAVDPQQQRSGIGSVLVEATEREISSRGGGRIYIETSGKSQYVPTQGFYRKCGYVLEATLVDFYRQGDDKLIFVKHVA